MTARPPIPKPPYNGRCLCGHVRYSLSSWPIGIYACHCADCRKMSGGTHLLMVAGFRATFSHDQGVLHRYVKQADSGNQIDIVHCHLCGTRLWHEPRSARDLVFIAAGTLDDPSWVVPTTHIWIEKAPPGARFTPDAELIEGAPKSRQVLFDAFDRLYPR